MARYIDADKFISWLNIGHTCSPFKICYSGYDIKVMIGMQPAADVVEVVRCKDCKYWVEDKDLGMFCNHWGSTLTESRENDFCSYGERRE